MKLTIFLLLFFALSGISSIAKTINPAGDYILTKAKAGEESQDIYSMMSFKSDGTLEMDETAIGTWNYDKKAITITSEVIKEFDGTWSMSKDDKNDMVLEKDRTALLFTRIEKNEIGKVNENSGLTGVWDMQSENGTSALALNSPDKVTLVHQDGGVITTTKGMWIFIPEKNILVLLTDDRDFKGEYRITKKNGNVLTLNFNGEIIKAVKKEQPKLTMENLNWKDDDFYTEDGDFKYADDEQKLPWKTEDEIWDTYSGLTKLVYTFSKMIGEGTFDTKEVTADVDIDEKLEIKNIFSGLDNDNKVSYDMLKYVFPVNCNVFRVAGTEKLTTPAGTFDCTVVEAMGDFDEKIKIWMINDKPDIVAKVIKQRDDDMLGHYYMFELKEIDTF